MEERIQKIEVAAKKTWPVIMAWVGGITALIAFFGSVAGGITWLINHHRHAVEYRAKMALAETETSQKQYQAALTTYGEILKDDPLDRQALDEQLDTAMIYVENFSISVGEGEDVADLSGPALDGVLPVLTSGLTREKQTRWADVEAHLGWAHFLNAKLAQRENDSVAVEDWRAALSTDPTNVYANAMLGNWMLQSGGDLKEAVEHFQTAVRTGRARPFVRQLQIGGLLHLEVPGARAEMMRVANQMRKGGEQLDPGMRRRISNWCIDPMVVNLQELREVLSAVSTEDAWQTYLWLEGGTASGAQEDHDLKHEFIHANLLELSGDRDAALGEFRQLWHKLRHQPGSLRDQVGSAVARLTAIPGSQ